MPLCTLIHASRTKVQLGFQVQVGLYVVLGEDYDLGQIKKQMLNKS